MRKTIYVDPMIGTVGDEQQTSFHGGGKTHPGACYPFGMVQLSPDTVTGGDNGTGYNYCQSTIEGFSFNHMSGIGWYGDLGNLQIMPIVGQTDLRSGSNAEVPFLTGTEGWKSPFDHGKEVAKAGYYSVFLDRYGILAEATVSKHAGQLRFTYPESAESGLIFNFSRRIAGRASHQIVEMNENYIYGCITCDHKDGGFGRGGGRIDYRLWFYLEVSKPILDARFFENEELRSPELKTLCSEDAHLLLRFPTEEGEQVQIRCGISYTDIKGAERNLREECPTFDFDDTYARADAAWERALGVAQVEGTDETDLTLFYTCLYHTMLDPRTAVDADGRYRWYSTPVRKSDFELRTMFSGWDVYRSEFPLLTLISPQTVSDEINSLLAIAKERNSSFPRWELMGLDSGCMTGDPGTIVMADAYRKGIRSFDAETAYEIAIASARSTKALDGKPFRNTRPCSPSYDSHAYVPGDLSSTLEYLMADYALAKMAEEMGREEDRAFLDARAFGYAENYNEALGFMAPRSAEGEFLPVRDEYDTKGCIESNIFQQSMFVPYDLDGLAALFGKERFLALLERMFEGADLTALWNENYNHSNEPCHNLTHYFTALGAPARTQYWTRRVQKEAYRLGAFGFCGNEDVGQLSAWYVLSALGFAQICMGDDRFYMNTPLFREATVTLDPRYHGCAVAQTLLIRCDRDPLTHPYIEAVTLNGAPIERPYLTYGELTNGGVLELALRSEA